VSDDWDVDGFITTLQTIIPIPKTAKDEVTELLEERIDIEERFGKITEWALVQFQAGLSKREEEFGEETFETVKRQAMLRAIDGLWMEHLETMDALRDAVSLRAYGQRDPLIEYKREAIGAYRNLEAIIRPRALQLLFHAGHQHQHQHKHQHKHVSENRGDGEEGEKRAPVKKKNEVGRNDPCPCGSGKKYKKCGLINAPEHRA